jgi:hypothetical protein
MGRYDLHLSEREFWQLTLRELNALIERHNNHEEWLNYRAALTPSILAEVHRDKKKKPTPYTPADFMPKKSSPKKQSKTLTAQEAIDYLRRQNAMLGGKEVIHG